MAKSAKLRVTMKSWAKDLSVHHRLKRSVEAMMRNKGGTDRSWSVARTELLPLRETDFPRSHQADFAAIEALWGKAVRVAGNTTHLRPSILSPGQRGELTERLLRIFAAHCRARGRYP